MKKAFLSTLLHLFELVVIGVVVYAVLHFFSVDSETVNMLVMLVVAAVVKFARAHEAVPFKDYTR
uniref:Uncharacterized protein n=1 Tax=viral metagenome TaxID=1070528 RepID=A0A6M3J5U4_9ZZZZ